MRGIEAALAVWRKINEGSFASEVLRKKSHDLPEGDRILAASLVYGAMRRAIFWKHLAKKYSGRPLREFSPAAGDAVVLGIAGIAELRKFPVASLVNALVEFVKKNGFRKEVPVVNAVLRRAAREARKDLKKYLSSPQLKDLCLACGVPYWVGTSLSDNWGRKEARQLLKLMTMRAYVSLRVSPGADENEIVSKLRETGYKVWKSPMIDYSLRMASSVFPPNLYGYSEGLVTPQTESSMMVAEVVASNYEGGLILDMCCGRGIKTTQIAQILGDAPIEAWELSQGRISAAERELERLKLKKRSIVLKRGNALELEPDERPSLVFVDVPCSGSGTWARHPDGKMRQNKDKLEHLSALQGSMLCRALEMVKPGGKVVYSTCSLLRAENELVVGEAAGKVSGVVEIPLSRPYDYARRGRPWGYYIWPALPWVDGFYMAVLKKRP
ncbi:transcription antitermination factor NusB [Thermovirga sp.]|uniref:RsmB/NOP family class I SAM-dependent RNA methyltransferase n=1 Tax=Thermovirga sp. TaxID=2699834 RepID=UPI0025DEAB6D|nr:transcription antitermination factor NusB [Thermovirga sp.]MBO8153775.1 RNA methyltransferase [Thermovirga sp.]